MGGIVLTYLILKGFGEPGLTLGSVVADYLAALPTLIVVSALLFAVAAVSARAGRKGIH